jgi:hypothetical protein
MDEDYATPAPASTKPPIRKMEVSWHATCAAIRARAAAEARGIDPEARAALVSATSGAATGLPPIVLGTLWAFEESEPKLAELVGECRHADQALTCLTVLEPERVLVSLLAGDLDEIRLGMIDTAARVTPERANQLDAHFATEMRRLKHLAGGGAAGDAGGKK